MSKIQNDADATQSQRNAWPTGSEDIGSAASVPARPVSLIPAPTPLATVHREPAAGGSYTRDPATGALTKTPGPVPAPQPAQE